MFLSMNHLIKISLFFFISLCFCQCKIDYRNDIPAKVELKTMQHDFFEIGIPTYLSKVENNPDKKEVFHYGSRKGLVMRVNLAIDDQINKPPYNESLFEPFPIVVPEFYKMYSNAVGGKNPQKLRKETFNDIPCLIGDFKAEMSGIAIYYKVVFADMKNDRAVTIILIGREVDREENEPYIKAILESLKDLQA